MQKYLKKISLLITKFFFDEKLKLFEDAIFVYKYLIHCNTIATFKQVFYCYNVNQFSTTSKYYGSTFWTCLRLYRDVKEKVQDEIRRTDFTLHENLSKKSNRSDSFKILYTFYSIYRDKNKSTKPKNKYNHLKYNIKESIKLMGSKLKFESGFPKIISKSISLHPIIAHLILTIAFYLKRN